MVGVSLLGRERGLTVATGLYPRPKKLKSGTRTPGRVHADLEGWLYVHCDLHRLRTYTQISFTTEGCQGNNCNQASGCKGDTCDPMKVAEKQKNTAKASQLSHQGQKRTYP